MTWSAVARKDFEDAIRSRWLWGLSVVFVLVFSFPAVVRLYSGDLGGPQNSSGIVQLVIFFMKEATAIVVPLTAVVVAYASITRERDSGTMKLLLSMPHSRTDVVIGKLVGRSAVIVVPVLLGFLVSILLLIPGSSALDWLTYVQFALLTAFLGVVFVGISVGISAAANGNRQAILGSGGAFALFWFGWDFLSNRLVDGAIALLGDVGVDVATATRYEIVLLLKLLNPIQAYKTLVDALFMSALNARLQMFGFFLGIDPRAREALGSSLSVIYGDVATVVYMLLWLVVPIAVGAFVFQSTDL
ncbi:ABC transporter permease subunit [Haloplanus halobius]|uniref:ABC transporter permease subunit n=1 Tax=Haloplanus halobius TaxID=2934938 RepID=UPI00200FC6FA|nr:ABC transporter permease subunit [Haloplanus sp. XH21]